MRDFAALGELKRVFDPHGTLNPGKTFENDATAGSVCSASVVDGGGGVRSARATGSAVVA